MCFCLHLLGVRLLLRGVNGSGKSTAMNMLLPFLLDGRVAAANEAVYYQRQTPLSEARYKPRILADQRRLYRDVLREALRLLGESGLPAAQRAALLPALLRYAGRHAWKLRRLVLASLGLRRP